MNYNKLLGDLVSDWDAKYHEYKATILRLKNEAQATANSVNPKIAEINSERIQLRKEIKALYEFLGFFGDIGKRITPFDYVTEDYITPEIYSPDEQGTRPEVKSDEANAFVKTMAAIFTPLPITLIKNHKSKNEILQTQRQFELEKISWEKQIADCEAEVSFLKTANEIAEMYRNIVVVVKDAIDEKIIPELSGISSFLYADAIKNCVIEGTDPADVQPQSIAVFQNTPYDRHYVFVQNAFDYYTLISAFFKESVLTKMLNDHEVTQEERDEFEKNIAEIKAKEGKLSDHTTFGGK